MSEKYIEITNVDGSVIIYVNPNGWLTQIGRAYQLGQWDRQMGLEGFAGQQWVLLLIIN